MCEAIRLEMTATLQFVFFPKSTSNHEGSVDHSILTVYPISL